jgi:hypothetical protein
MAQPLLQFPSQDVPLPQLVRLGTPTRVGVPKQPPSSGAAAVPYAIGLQQARARHHIHDFRHLLTHLAEQGRPNREGHGSGSHLEDPRCCKKAPGMFRGLLSYATLYLQNSAFSEWAMLGSNQRPPPCKLGQSFSDRYYPVRKSRLHKRFSAFLGPSFYCSVRMRPAPVAARLHHLIHLAYSSCKISPRERRRAMS